MMKLNLLKNEHLNKAKDYWQQLLKHEQVQKVKDYWQKCSLREKKAIIVGGTLLGLFIIYQFIWSPYLEHVASMRSKIITQQKTLLWMQAADKEINKIESHSVSKHKTISPVMMLSYLQKQIKQAGLESNLTQLKQASNDTITMHFNKVEFDKLMKLITIISKEQSVLVSQLSALSDNSPGVVTADVSLKIL